MDTRSLAAASDRLREEFAARVPSDSIDEIFRNAADELSKEARVPNFVPLLAERRTRERLTALVQG